MPNLNWDSTLENDGGVQILPAGNYWFRVLDWEKGKSSAKKCDMAKVRLEVRDRTGEYKTRVTESLLLHSDFEWKLSAFFRSIGLKEHGKKFVMDWSKVSGAFGWAKVKVDSFKGREGNEIEVNKIDSFLDRPDGSAPMWVKEPLESEEAAAETEDDDDGLPF